MPRAACLAPWHGLGGTIHADLQGVPWDLNLQATYPMLAPCGRFVKRLKNSNWSMRCSNASINDLAAFEFDSQPGQHLIEAFEQRIDPLLC